MKNSIHQFLLLFLLNNIYSQESDKFTFQVLDDKTKEPISFATILLEKLNRGTHADFDGFFQLPFLISNNETFVISAIGYNAEEFILSNYSKNVVNKILFYVKN